MFDTKQFLSLVDRFAEATGIADVTLSSRVFADSKKIAALRGSGDITLGRVNAAVQWFSDHWPENAVWPDDIARPAQTTQNVEAAE